MKMSESDKLAAHTKMLEIAKARNAKAKEKEALMLKCPVCGEILRIKVTVEGVEK
jgi:uncharacterized C2H2 Zn-finger protein